MGHIWISRFTNGRIFSIVRARKRTYERLRPRAKPYIEAVSDSVASPGRAPKVSRSLETAQLSQKVATVDGRSTVASLFCEIHTDESEKIEVLLLINAS